MVVHSQVQEFRVRYFDGQTWYAEWQRAELPRALEITPHCAEWWSTGSSVPLCHLSDG